MGSLLVIEKRRLERGIFQEISQVLRSVHPSDRHLFAGMISLTTCRGAELAASPAVDLVFGFETLLLAHIARLDLGNSLKTHSLPAKAVEAMAGLSMACLDRSTVLEA